MVFPQHFKLSYVIDVYHAKLIDFNLHIEPARVAVHPEDTWVEEGGKAVLSCRASGDKPITYKWYKNKVIVESSEKVTADGPDLVLRDAIPADANVYFCEVSNHKGVDPHRSKTARIEIYSKLTIKLKCSQFFLLDSYSSS